jgi:hypothetical protein
VEKKVRDMMADYLNPFMSIVLRHVEDNERTQLKFIACSKRELAKFSSDESLRSEIR